ncbi:precorrin-6Y C5,15-methyltransferase [Fusobacterium polymorphum]|uniref:Precorrin-6Y C5,15-methyltransferase n=1 Tax=Fusobacterium nucleatum subsp. polymorphum TaxID=76857 RepID=A0AAC8ZZE7_FUSNP|nr:precorrin-6y C5,15-methyltransferase (decarboxylating) subunit CbiE [Fusobacterium nucleatum]ALM93758.1 precorrin-6Y C5,15-methyltransferase [Fusobacterium polymorphum]ALQ42225.1 precorrin-6Y C5,15-methyltransferase [Fusobacterium polymorphum]
MEKVITIKEWLVNVVQLNKINVVGLGPGNIKYLSNAGIDCIKEAEIIVGSTRQLSDLKTIISEKQKIYILGKLTELITYLKENIERRITIIVSGDTGYYSLVPYLSKNLSKDILNIIPNISSYQYLFSKIGENWQNFRLASVHGREFDYIKNIDDEDIAGLVLLTDDIQNPYEVSKNLYNSGVRNLTVIVGENLSYDNEKITILEIEDYKKLNRKFDMNVLILKKGENYGKE